MGTLTRGGGGGGPETGRVTEGEWRNNVPANFTENQSSNGCRGARSAEKIRDCYKEFFMGAGALPWQENVFD